MSMETLKNMLEAKGTFPDEEDVLANFDRLFALADQNKESLDDLAWAFLQALDQLANVKMSLDAGVLQRLYRWTTAHWTTTPPSLCERLCALLINVASPDSLRFMKDQHDQASDATAKSILADYIQSHPISRAEAAATTREGSLY